MGGTLEKNLTSSVSRGRFRLMELEGSIGEQMSTPVSSVHHIALSPVLMKASSKAPMSSSVEKILGALCHSFSGVIAFSRVPPL